MTDVPVIVELRGDNRQLVATFRDTSGSARRLQGDLRDTGKEADRTENRFVRLSRAANDLGQTAQRAGRQMSVMVTAPLVAAGAAAVKFGMDYDNARAFIVRSTGAIGTELDGMMRSFERVHRQVPQRMEEVSATLGELRTRTGLTGQALESLTKQTLDYARVNREEGAESARQLGRLMAALELDASKGSRALDMVTRAAQDTGIAANNLIQFVIEAGPAFEEMGFGLERSIALFSQFERFGARPEELLSSMNILMNRMAQDGVRNAEEGFRRLLDSIREAPTLMNSVIIASEAFGARVGAKVAEDIRAGRFEIEEFVYALQRAEGTVQRTAEESETFAEKWSIVRSQVELSLAPLGVALLDALQSLGPHLQTTIDLATRASTSFSEMSDGMQKVILSSAAVVAATGPALLVMGSMARSVSALVLLYQQMVFAVSGVRGAVASMIALERALGATNLASALMGRTLKTLRLAWIAALGPVGLFAAAVAGIAVVFWQVNRAGQRFQEQLDELRQPTERAAAAFERFNAAAGVDHDLSSLSRLENQLSILREEARQAADEWERLNRASERRAQGTGILSGMQFETPTETAARERAEATRMQAEAAAAQLEILRQFPDAQERFAMGQERIEQVSQAVVGVLERLGIVQNSANDAMGNTADLVDRNANASADFTRQLNLLQATLSGPMARAQVQFNQRVADLQSQVEKGEISINQKARAMGLYRQELDKLAQALRDEINEQIKSFAAEMDDISDALDGTHLRAIRTYQTGMQQAIRLLNTGRISFVNFGRSVNLLTREFMHAATPTDTFAEQIERIVHQAERSRVDLVAEQMMLVSIALEEATDPEKVARLERVLEILGGVGEEGRRAEDAINGLARSIATAITSADGQNLVRSLGASFRAHGASMIGNEIEKILEDSFRSAFERLGKDDEWISENMGGFMMAAGEAMAGNWGAAIGTAIGQAVAGPIGAIIGNTLGSFLDRLATRSPRFDIAGSRARGPGFMATNPEFMRTALDEMAFNFRRMEPEDEAAIRQTFRNFHQQLASAVGAANLQAARDAVSLFSWESRFHGENLEEMLEAQFSAVVNSIFDSYIAAIIESDHDIETNMQRLADAVQIQRQVFMGRALGLTGADLMGATPPGTPPGTGIPPIGGGGPPPFDRDVGDLRPHAADLAAFQAAIEGTGDAASVTNPILQQTLSLVDELQRPHETLGETFLRLRQIAGSLDTAFALIGRAMDKSRADLLRWGDALETTFGEGLSDAMGTIFARFFTDEERFTQIGNMASERARELLERIGLDVTDAMLTQAGFREVLDELFGALSPEDTALLIEAGVAIDQLIGAEESLMQIRRRAEEELAEQERRRQESLRDLTRSIADEIREMQWSPLRVELRAVAQQHRDNIMALRELEASEAVFMMERERHAMRLEVLAGMARASLADLAREFNNVDEQVQQIAPSVGRVANNLRDAIIRGLEGVQDWLDRQLVGPLSSLRADERLDVSGRQFFDAISAVQGGDFDQLGDLPRLADSFLRLASTFHGTSTREFREIELSVRDAMQAIAAIEPPPEQQQPTLAGQNIIAEATQSTARSAMEQALMARRIIDELGVLTGLTGESAAEVAARYDLSIAELISAMTGELPALTGQELAQYFDELVAETDAQLSALGRLEEIATHSRDAMGQIADILRDIRDLVRPEGSFATGIAGLPRDMRIQAHRGEIVMDPTASAHLQRYGIQVHGGGPDPETRRLLQLIQQEVAELKQISAEGNDQRDRHIAATQTAGDRTAAPLRELVTIEQSRKHLRNTTDRRHP